MSLLYDLLHMGKKPAHSPIIDFAEQGKTEEVEQLLRDDPELVYSLRPEDGSTPLHLAATNGHLAVVELLVRYDADVDAPDKEQATALLYASLHGHTEVAAKLLSAGADPNIMANKGATPLHAAALNGQEETVHLLLRNGADARIVDGDNMTPADLVDEAAHPGLAKLLDELSDQS